MSPLPLFFFFFNDTATTEIYTLSLHDALPICRFWPASFKTARSVLGSRPARLTGAVVDRKSTRLNSSHSQISYAVFCLKKKKKKKQRDSRQARIPVPARTLPVFHAVFVAELRT